MPDTLYITRKSHWSDREGPEITQEEWHACIDDDPEMYLVGFAEVETPGGDSHPVSTGLAVWLAYSQHGEGNLAWFDHQDGHIVVSRADEEIIRKMQRIAAILGARVEGAHGERYDLQGHQLTA